MSCARGPICLGVHYSARRKLLRLQASHHGYHGTQSSMTRTHRDRQKTARPDNPLPPRFTSRRASESKPNTDGTPSYAHNYTSYPYFRCPRCSPSMSIVIPFLKSAVDSIDNAPAPPRVGRGAATVHRATACDCTKDPCLENNDARMFACTRAGR